MSRPQNHWIISIELLLLTVPITPWSMEERPELEGDAKLRPLLQGQDTGYFRVRAQAPSVHNTGGMHAVVLKRHRNPTELMFCLCPIRCKARGKAHTDPNVP